MKKIICGLLSVALMFSFFVFDTFAVSEEDAPRVIDFSLMSAESLPEDTNETRATGLILSYTLGISKSGNTLSITGLTNCASTVVKCGFKNLTVERRKNSSSSWSDYYDYGDVYREATGATLSTTLSVASGYQYRVTCKHYAKKSLLSTQTISNVSNIVTVS